MWADAIACLSILAAARHAGRAHAAARPYGDQGARRAPARQRGRGIERASRCASRPPAAGADRAGWHRPHRAIHRGAAGLSRRTRYIPRSDDDGTRWPAFAGGLIRGADMAADEHLVTTLEQLDALYGEKSPNSVAKEIDHLSDGYRKLIEAAPFVAIATGGPEGFDCSPKGDAPGFVRVLDDKTLAIPDRPGNNRLDGFRNIVRDPSIGLLFLIPGVGETLRVNG